MNFESDSYEDLNNEDNIFPDQNSDPFDSKICKNDINSVFVGNNNLFKELNNSIFKENNNVGRFHFRHFFFECGKALFFQHLF